MAQSGDERPSAAYRQLPDLQIFAEADYGQWAGSADSLEIDTGQNGRLPIDTSEIYEGSPSHHIHINGANGWWSFILAGKDWEPYNIAPYHPNGALEFNVKGANGGEDFNIKINDVVWGRNPENISSEKVSISDIIPVTNEWQHVTIPLSSFLSGNAGFNQEQLLSIIFSGVLQGDGEQELQFWLNDIKFTSEDVEPSHAQIKLNQMGYTPNGRKTAHISGFDEQLNAQIGTPFTIRDVSNNQIVYADELTLVAEYDAVVSGERILAADFSGLQTAGEYYLSVDAYQVDDSPSFTVNENIYHALIVDGVRYFYLQRSGIHLEDRFAGEFAREAGHMQDAEAVFRSGSQSPKDVSGGWYDAGDYGKYVNAGATAVSDLLWTYELFPEQFPDNHLNIPESGNGAPDLLDELRWELDWILKMQDPESGGFYHMVQDTEKMAVSDAHETRYIEDTDGSRENIRPTSTTGSATAVLAHAAIIFEPIDPEYTEQLLTAAKAGWSYLENNHDSIAPVPGPYSDEDDSDNRFWAATALYRATGEAEYHDYVKRVYQDVETFFESETDNAYGISRMEMIGWLLYAHSDNTDSAVMLHFNTIFNDWSALMITRWQDSNWDISLMDEDFYWGSNYVALTTPLVIAVGSHALGEMDKTAVTMSQQALDYILGNNPLSFSYISGYGENSVQNPFSNQWSYDAVANVPNGIFVGGPNSYTNPLLYSNFAGKRYNDNNGSWTTNEHTIYWNSALVFHAALANQMSKAGTPLVISTPDSETDVEPTVVPTSMVVDDVIVDETAVSPTAVPQKSTTEPEPPPRTPITTNNSLLTTLIVAVIILIIAIIVSTVLILRMLKKR